MWNVAKDMTKKYYIYIEIQEKENFIKQKKKSERENRIHKALAAQKQPRVIRNE